jgi:hypothetical protein
MVYYVLTGDNADPDKLRSFLSGVPPERSPPERPPQSHHDQPPPWGFDLCAQARRVRRHPFRMLSRPTRQGCALGKTASVSVLQPTVRTAFTFQFDRQTADGTASSAARAEEAEVLEGFRR